MAKIMDPILPILEYWAIVLDSFEGPGRSLKAVRLVFGVCNHLGGLMQPHGYTGYTSNWNEDASRGT